MEQAWKLKQKKETMNNQANDRIKREFVVNFKDQLRNS
jgi:hypothetical protein